MAFYNKTDSLPGDPALPRDATAIEESAHGGSGILSAVIVLLIIAAAFGLYFLYAGSGSTTRTVNEPIDHAVEPSHPCTSSRASAAHANSDTIG